MTLITRIHFIVGTAFFLLFLLTGVYMLMSFPEQYQGREEVRMMYRATHIYLLMSALINLMTGAYLVDKRVLSFLQLRRLSSVLIIVAPMLFFLAFMIEPPAYLIERPISFWAVLSLVVGVILHASLSVTWLHEKLEERFNRVSS